MDGRSTTFHPSVFCSVYDDADEMIATKGKRGRARNTIEKAHEAASFPPVKCTTLAGTKLELPKAWYGKVTLVMVGFRQAAQPMLDQYRERFEAQHGGDKKCQVNNTLEGGEQDTG